MAGGNTPETWAKRHISLSRTHAELLDGLSYRCERLQNQIECFLQCESFVNANPLNLTTIPERLYDDEKFIYIKQYQKEKALAGIKLVEGMHSPDIFVYFNDGETMTDDEIDAIDANEWIDLDDLNQWAYLPVLGVLTEKIKTYIKENKAKGYEKILG